MGQEPRICVQREFQREKSHIFEYYELLTCRVKMVQRVKRLKRHGLKTRFIHRKYKVGTHGFLLVCSGTVGQRQRLEAGVLSDAL